MDRPMKWHKFLIYFSLWASAVFVFLRGAGFAALGIFSEESNSQSFPLPGVKTLNVVYGVFYLACAVYHIYTRYQLARFRKGAPKHLLILYAIIPVSELLYAPLMLIAAGLPVSLLLEDPAKAIGGTIGGIFGTWLVCVLNKIYYDKRKELFIN